ncbi:SHOCT domain-containing protein [Fructobacillus ficulneus]|uniref:SHOCT domain-containing protein n=1 Tax=Fructobacillus ficulneus TaxID=157463 RepID=A0A0K8MH27_9LACO|nr:SHOCT domain-containing protein [Fructobacillus ficulneus]GAO99871.1 hypothetical protein FFIC_241470 [Fructobacillus ficulneus]
MNCAICGNKLKSFQGFKVNKVKQDFVRKICGNCVANLGITKIDSETKNALLLSHIEDLKNLIENNEKFSASVQLEKSSTEKEEELKNEIEQQEKFNDVKNDFIINGSIYSDVLMRDDTKEILLTKNNSSWYRVFQYSDIETFDRKIDEDVSYNTKKKNGITRAIVGDIIAGPVGAIVGSGTAKSSSTENREIKSIDFSIRFNSGYVYSISFSGSNSDIKKADSLYVHLNGIINSNQSTIQSSDSSSNNIDDLTKLKELVDAGVLTEEEFTAKKKQILGI